MVRWSRSEEKAGRGNLWTESGDLPENALYGDYLKLLEEQTRRKGTGRKKSKGRQDFAEPQVLDSDPFDSNISDKPGSSSSPLDPAPPDIPGNTPNLRTVHLPSLPPTNTSLIAPAGTSPGSNAKSTAGPQPGPPPRNRAPTSMNAPARTFAGESRGEKLVQWIRDYERYGVQAGWDDAKLAEVFQLYLEVGSTAEEWYEALQRADPKLDTKKFSEIKKAFLLRWPPPAQVAILMMQRRERPGPGEDIARGASGGGSGGRRLYEGSVFIYIET
ncbi:hypothetical protein FRC00_001456 [Tulasnella sp. 408]|nr:hypothetical protein FRC00_001456 [Tulasnella sp. 408]